MMGPIGRKLLALSKEFSHKIDVEILRGQRARGSTRKGCQQTGTVFLK